METTKISLGTIYKSHHFNNDADNETHNGIYVNVAGWSLGTYCYPTPDFPHRDKPPAA
jgi:hypothetical protein